MVLRSNTSNHIYIYISIYRYLHLFPYAYVYNTVVTRCPLWSFPYRIHTRILCWDPHRIHTRIHIGIHTAIAKHKPGFVGQLTTTLGVSFATRTLGSEPVLKTGPARRTAGRECWQTDTHLMRTLILRVSTQCNATTKLLAQKAKHKVARCKTARPPQCMSLVIQIWTVINGPGHTAIGAQTSEQEHLHSTYVCLKINLSYKYTIHA